MSDEKHEATVEWSEDEAQADLEMQGDEADDVKGGSIKHITADDGPDKRIRFKGQGTP